MREMMLCKIAVLFIFLFEMICFTYSQGCSWTPLRFEFSDKQSVNSPAQFTVTTLGTLADFESFLWTFNGVNIARHTYISGDFPSTSVPTVGLDGVSSITKVNDSAATMELSVTALKSSNNGGILYASRTECMSTSETNRYILNVEYCDSSSGGLSNNTILANSSTICAYKCTAELSCTTGFTLTSQSVANCTQEATWDTSAECESETAVSTTTTTTTAPSHLDTRSTTTVNGTGGVQSKSQPGTISGAVICAVGGICFIGILIYLGLHGFDTSTPILAGFIVSSILWLVGFILCFVYGSAKENTENELQDGAIAGIVLGAIGVLGTIGCFVALFLQKSEYTPGSKD